MPIGSTLAVVRNMLKAELGVSLSVGMADDALLNQQLANKERYFLDGWDWSHLRTRWDKAIVANDRYVSFPTADVIGTTCSMNFARDFGVFVLFNTKYLDVTYGIDERDYNFLNPDLAQYGAPILKWQRELGDATKFEIWPAASAAQTVRFIGEKVATGVDVTSDASTFQIDDLLLALAVAVPRLMADKNASAQEKAGLLQQRWSSLRGKDPHRKSFTPGKYENGRPRWRPTTVNILHPNP